MEIANTKKELFGLIDSIPGEMGFSDRTARKTFREVGQGLILKGYTVDGAYNLLKDLYEATEGDLRTAELVKFVTQEES